MRLTWVLAAALALGPAAAAAQEASALFIAPLGQPYRAETTAAAMQTWFSAADADQDGKLTEQEFVAHAMLFHPMLDRSRDGVVTSAESSAMFRATAPEMYAPLPPLRGGQATMRQVPGAMLQPRERANEDTRPRGAARFGLLTEVEPVMSCDVDMSRWVSGDEYRACAERRFRLLDSNTDGLFDLAESPRAAELATPEEE